MSFTAENGNESESTSTSSSQWPQQCRHFEFTEIQLATHNFDESLVIGRGGFGKVYKGTIVDGASPVVAAIKRLDSMSNQGATEFWAEVEMLSKLRHRHLVSLFGYCNHGREMILVYEYIPNGTLEDHLHKLRTPLSWLQRLKICIGAAHGLECLHIGMGIELRVIHRDVKSSNILLLESWEAKISDFGLSRISPKDQPTTHISTKIKGSFGYLDPNYFRTGRLTRKSDVYAFGVVLFEVLCRKRAVDGSPDNEEWGLARWVQESIKQGNLRHIIDSDMRDQISPKCLKGFVRIADRCLHDYPEKRPTIAEVVIVLESVLALQEKANNSLQDAGRTIFSRVIDILPFPSKGEYSGGDGAWRNSFSERDPPAIKKTKTEKSSKSTEFDFDHPQIINVQNYSIFTATWNVGGKSPSNKMNLDDWLHAAPPADIYVLGFQEIVTLNAANILCAKDNGPAKRWLALIRKTLNNHPSDASGGNGCYTPSPVPDLVAEYDADFEGSTRHKISTFFRRKSFQASTSDRQPQLDQRYSVSDRAMFGHRSSDCSSASYSPSDYSASHRPSDYSACASHKPSDYSRWGSSDDDYGPMEDLTSTNSFSPINMSSQSNYCLVASKQMVGVFLTVWVKNDLRDHVRNLKISCVGRGLMGYLRNKGSVSVSMLLHQTSFCFVCTHLTSGQKEGDELRRNSDFMEIVKKTRFPHVQGVKNDDKSPETILEHDRIIWLGDLNYRIALSYRSAKALVEMQNWRALLENDQLRIEQRQGRVFQGWKEGKIYFPPTYKYLTNSDKYTGDNLHPKEKRTPAWCDRILWYGEGLHQLSYVCGESQFSDHQPVYSLFWAEVELVHSQFRRSMSHSRSRIKVEELLPYANGYTELCFF